MKIYTKMFSIPRTRRASANSEEDSPDENGKFSLKINIERSASRRLYFASISQIKWMYGTVLNVGQFLRQNQYKISDNAPFKNSRPLIVNKPTLYIIAGNVLQSKAKKARTKRLSSQMPQFCPTNFILTSKFASPSLTSGYVTGTKTKLQQPAFNPFGHTMVN